MQIAKKTSISKNLFKIILGGLLVTAIFCAPSAFAATDYIFFSINGDTTLSSMTQGDELIWGSNCDPGATVNWEIWYDANANSTIDPSTDVLLTSENITDGNPVTEYDPILDGWAIGEPLNLGAEPGDYIFKATDIATGLGTQDILTMVAMSSPPNQITGHIIIPGYTPPNSFLANRLIFSESEDEYGSYEPVFLAVTDDNGFYSINIGAGGTGLEFYLGVRSIPGFVAPQGGSAIASGVVTDVDFTYIPAVDSVWGFVKDETGGDIPFITYIAAESEDLYKDAATDNGRYAIYFSEDDKGDWNLACDTRISPDYLDPYWFEFSHDTLTSFQYDLTLTKTDTAIYARVTENGGLPSNNYRIDAYSDLLSSSAEAVSGTGANNVAEISVSSLDNSGWTVSLNRYDDDYPIPVGLIVENGDAMDVSPGDTVSFNLIDGKLISGTVTQDVGDGPIEWDDVVVYASDYTGNFYDSEVQEGGAYTIYTDTGSHFLGAYADGYISDPAWSPLDVTGDINDGPDFIINEAHCRVSGSLVNLPLPLDPSYYEVYAMTGMDGSDGYYVSAQIDNSTGTYIIYLGDGDWTITPPCCFPDFEYLGPTEVTIGESPDTARTIDFEYVSTALICGDADGNELVNILDCSYIINYLYRGGPPPPSENSVDVDGSGGVNILDVSYLINYLYRSGPVPDCP